MPFVDFEGADAQPAPWNFQEKATWHRSDEEQDRPEVLLRQVGPNLFQLAEGFRYTTPPGAPKGAWNVPRHDVKVAFGGNNSTDLASVPSWLWWFVASYGRHSRAALLHDHLIDPSGRQGDGQGGGSGVPRRPRRVGRSDPSSVADVGRGQPRFNVAGQELVVEAGR